jgi:hypothetical protein
MGFGVSRLSELTDVNLSGVANNDRLVFQASTGTWIPESAAPSGVTSVSNTDGTLTISPTTGSVVASLNLSNANTWLNSQTLGLGNSWVLLQNYAGSGTYYETTIGNTSTLPWYGSLPAGFDKSFGLVTWLNSGASSPGKNFCFGAMGNSGSIFPVAQITGGSPVVFDIYAGRLQGSFALNGQQFTGNADFTNNVNISGYITQGGINYSAMASTYSTASTTQVSSGLGAAVTAGPNSRNLIRSVARASNNTLTDGVQVSLYRSITSIPIAGSAPNTGDVQLCTNIYTQEGAASNYHSMDFQFLDTGLTAGIAYYYYLTIMAVTGGTASICQVGSDTTILAETI